jgi:DNA polymerase ligase (LigD)-like protein
MGAMPRFVLLYHDCPPNYERKSHWDFMLESGDVLRTWALERLPRDWQTAHSKTSAVHPNCLSLAVDNAVAATHLGDHRRDYLELEGPLSGDRGTVVRVAAGTYRSEHQSAVDWRVVLTGDDLASRVQLSRSEADDERWTLSCS